MGRMGVRQICREMIASLQVRDEESVCESRKLGPGGSSSETVDRRMKFTHLYTWEVEDEGAIESESQSLYKYTAEYE